MVVVGDSRDEEKVREGGLDKVEGLIVWNRARTRLIRKQKGGGFA